MSHSSHRTTECLITSAVWLSRGPRLKLNLNDFNAALARPFGAFLGRSVVRDEAPDSVEGPDPRNAATTQLAEVRDDVHFSRRADHYIIELGFEHIRRGRAVLQIKPIHGQEKTVRVELIHHRFGLRSYERTGDRP